MNDFAAPVDPDELKRQRTRARALRDSPWWKRRISTGICYYCRRQVGSRVLTMDHLIPLGRGGRSVRGNVVPSCKDCNNRKRAFLPVEWQDYLGSLNRPTDDER